MKKDFIIRDITLKDAKAFLNLRIQTEAETEMMGYRKGERKETVAQATAKLKNTLSSKFSKIFVAEKENKLVGFVMIYGQDMQVYLKARGIATAVAKDYWRQGIGNALFAQGITWAKKNKVHRIELDVWKHNTQAIKLYKKFGFNNEGTRKDGIFLNGKYEDVIAMGLILS